MSLADRKHCVELVKEAQASGASQKAACEALGLSLRTVERWRQHPDRGDQRSGPKSPSQKALTVEEKQLMIAVANSPEYRDITPHKIVAKLADCGQFIASERSFYRVLKSAQLLAHRSKSKAKTNHPPRSLVAIKPNQVWSWDISYLPTTVKGRFFYLYIVEDIFSRLIVGWRVEEVESAEIGAQLIESCCREQSVQRGQITLHSDNGAPMVAATMLATLQRLGVAPSRSRPSVSDDNPFSEALFKTTKYCAQYPGRPFSTLTDAQAWVASFVPWYNTEHLHSEIRYLTPQSRHDGQDFDILYKRKEVYLEAKKKNPSRWSGATRNWSPIGQVFLNPNKEQKEAIRAKKKCEGFLAIMRQLS